MAHDRMSQYLLAISRRWWSLMSCAAFTLLSVISATRAVGNAWTIYGTAALAILFLFISGFLAWRDQVRRCEELLSASSKSNFPEEWGKLSAAFSSASRSARADWHTNRERRTTWHIACDSGPDGEVASLCNVAGTLLTKSTEIADQLPAEIIRESDPMFRWLSYVKSLRGSSESSYGQELDDKGEVLGLIFFGSVRDIAAISSQICRDCCIRDL